MPKSLLLFAFLFVAIDAVNGQAIELSNNPFSPNPRGSTSASMVNSAEVIAVADIERTVTMPATARAQSVAPATMSPPIRPSAATELYLVGPGDILFVAIENVATSRGYYSVRDDGTFELPIIGASVQAAGRTPDEIAYEISQRSKVFAGRKVEVKVREYSSHRIAVSGLVERSGDRFLQRESVPFFVVRADSGVDSKATHVIVRTSPSDVPKVMELVDPKLDAMYVQAGMTFEFVAESASSGNVYISGEINRSGKYSLANERGLTQLIGKAGGVRGDAAKVTIRRPGKNGTITSQTYDLSSIRKGKTQDPILLDGDMIEIRK